MQAVFHIDNVLLVKKAARCRVPLQDNIIPFSLRKEICHLQSRWPSAKHAVVKMANGILTVLVTKGGLNMAKNH